MRILAGGPARETASAAFHEYKAGLEAQGDGFSLEIRHEVVPDPGGPRWDHGKFRRVAAARQRFMDAGRDFGALFMVDTDVMLSPGVLRRLWEVDADVVFGVFWTFSDWGGFMADWPQVWDRNPYGWTPNCSEALRQPGINEVEVLGGGACSLIRGRGFESHYWPLLKSFERQSNMMAGEDRTYCLGLECRGIRQVAVTGLQISHVQAGAA